MEEFKAKLLSGDYIAVEKIFDNMCNDSIRDMCMMLAYDTENISIYSFIQYMFHKTNNTLWIKLAFDIMINPFCFLEGAYSVALFHARELLLIERNSENLERILFFYNIPEKIISEDEAKDISEELLRIDPENAIALSVLQNV